MSMRFYKQEKQAIGAAVFLFVLGLIGESLFHWPNFFSRSGALIVCVGIYFGYLQINALYAKGFEGAISDMESNKKELEMPISDEEIEKGAKGTVAHAKRFVLSQRAQNEKRVALVDVTILIAGTLIWGFGGLLKNVY